MRVEAAGGEGLTEGVERGDGEGGVERGEEDGGEGLDDGGAGPLEGGVVGGEGAGGWGKPGVLCGRGGVEGDK